MMFAYYVLFLYCILCCRYSLELLWGGDSNGYPQHILNRKHRYCKLHKYRDVNDKFAGNFVWPILFLLSVSLLVKKYTFISLCCVTDILNHSQNMHWHRRLF